MYSIQQITLFSAIITAFCTLIMFFGTITADLEFKISPVPSRICMGLFAIAAIFVITSAASTTVAWQLPYFVITGTINLFLMIIAFNRLGSNEVHEELKNRAAQKQEQEKQTQAMPVEQQPIPVQPDSVIRKGIRIAAVLLKDTGKGGTQLFKRVLEKVNS